MMADSLRTPAFDQAALVAAVLIGLFALVGAPFWAASAGVADTAVVVASAVLAAGLIALSIIDVRTFRLPDCLTLPLLVCGLIATWWICIDDCRWHVVAAIAGYAILRFTAAVYQRYRGCEGLGLGDAKLLAAGGAWLGVEALPTVLLWACLLASAQVLFSWKRRGGIDASTPVPFGPALSLGIWVVWLYGPLSTVS